MATIKLEHGIENVTITDVRRLEIDGLKFTPDFIATLGDHPDRVVAIRKLDDRIEIKIARIMTPQERAEFWT